MTLPHDIAVAYSLTLLDPGRAGYVARNTVLKERQRIFYGEDLPRAVGEAAAREIERAEKGERA